MPRAKKAPQVDEPPVIVDDDDVVPPPDDEDDYPPLEDLITSKADKLTLIRLISVDTEWGAKEKEAKASRKPIRNQIKRILGTYKVGKAMWNEFKISYFSSGRKSIDRAKLIAALSSLIQPDQIKTVLKACTKVSSSYTLKITPPGSKDEEDDE